MQPDPKMLASIAESIREKHRQKALEEARQRRRQTLTGIVQLLALSAAAVLILLALYFLG